MNTTTPASASTAQIDNPLVEVLLGLTRERDTEWSNRMAIRLETPEETARLLDIINSLRTALRALVNGPVRISAQANNLLSEHDPKVILARKAISDSLA